jgi:predicted amidophosphoribosyltransferase
MSGDMYFKPPCCWLCGKESTDENPVTFQKAPKAHECKRCTDEIQADAEKPLGPPPKRRAR